MHQIKNYNLTEQQVEAIKNLICLGLDNYSEEDEPELTGLQVLFDVEYVGF